MKALLIGLLATLASCATPHSGPTADVSSTFIAIEAGGTELNPLANAAGLVPGAAISLGARLAINKHYRGEPECESVAGWTSAIGWGAACNNLAVAAGAAPPVSLGMLAFCSIVVKNKRAHETAAWCGHYELTDKACLLGNLPDEATSARCIDGKLAVSYSLRNDPQ